MTNNISLYFHIPFCVKKCDYCAFYSLSGQDEDTKQRYFEALMRQMRFFPTDRTVKSVYFGGGTPPMLGRERLCKLVREVCERFSLSDDCEITVEVNPKTVDLEFLKQLRESGANRLSVGVQSADDAVLASIGRIHRFCDAEECIKSARMAGFDNISADLMFALPKQGLSTFRDTLNAFLRLDVEHISAYSLQLEEGTPLFERKDRTVFPDEELEEAQYELLCETLAEHGYVHYEISSFCKEGFESRHNMNYWAEGEYFGFGAAAHSYFDSKRFSAKADIDAYIEKSRDGLFAPTDYDSMPFITDEEAEEERVMLGLRTRYGAVVPKDAYKAAKRIADLGYGSFEDGILRLNSRGFRVSNEIIAEILI